MAEVIVLGGSGMLGSDLVAELRSRKIDIAAPTDKELDIGAPMEAASIASGKYGKPRYVVNCAAYTAVDDAETHAIEAGRLNLLGAAYVAQACAMADARLIHLSTDFVFDGNKTEPYLEDDETHPLGVYGTTKRDGEEAVLSKGGRPIVLRTSWLFGPNGKSFPRSILRAAHEGLPIRVVTDQTGNPTYTTELAKTIVRILEVDPPAGIYHATGPETMSWHDFALKILAAAGLSNTVEPITSAQWPTPAKRPAYSALSNAKLQSWGVSPMRPIDESLKEFVSRL